MRLACSRARLSEGSRMLISSAMMPITTNNSTRVKPLDLRECFINEAPFQTGDKSHTRGACGSGLWHRAACARVARGHAARGGSSHLKGHYLGRAISDTDEMIAVDQLGESCTPAARRCPWC